MPVSAVVAPLWHRATYRRLAYLALSPVLGTTYLLLLGSGVTLGLVLSVALVGIPILLGALLVIRWVATLERTLANSLLGTEIAPSRKGTEPATALAWLGALVRDPVTWRSVLWVMARPPLGLLTWTVLAAWLVLTGGIVAAPLTVADDSWPVPAWTAWLALPILTLALPHLVHVLAEIHAILACHLLGPSRGEELAVLREEARELSDRNRLARDLHDSVGHTLTVGVLQASAAERVFDTNPGFAKEALGTIARSHRTALEELDRVLGLMRENPPIGPAPALGGVAGVAESARAAGLPVDVVVSGDVGVVPMRVSAEAYRIVQEGVTNVLRHAGLVPTTVRIDVHPHLLRLAVENARPGHPKPVEGLGGGRGLRGVGERVRALGGTAESGPTPSGGFRLVAVVPFPPGP